MRPAGRWTSSSCAASAAALGLLAAAAIRLRFRLHAAVAVGTAVLAAVALVVFLPPRGALDDPQYYANGPDIPRALEAVESVEKSTHELGQELDAQLVGLARLVVNPGTPLETSLISRVADTGDPFVFVSGNHDSDTLERALARKGAIVLTTQGRLRPDGSHGPVVNRIAGLRIAGYSDPFERRSREDFADRYDNAPSPEMQDAFTGWMRGLLGKVDVIMVHEPALIGPPLQVLRDQPPPAPVVFVVGHTHHAAVERQPAVAVINGGSVGAGGSGNLTERTPLGIARLIYATRPRFRPLAADLVSIDPGSGSATAEHERLDASDEAP